MKKKVHFYLLNEQMSYGMSPLSQEVTWTTIWYKGPDQFL